MDLVKEILQLHREMVERWHRQEIDNPFQGLLAAICTQHSFNFQLWHEEDIARSPNAEDSVIAGVKRRIDRLNQQRNDWIEKIDDDIAERLAGSQSPADDAPLNTETIGSAVDRLSILALRIYHLGEQLQRPDISPRQRESVRDKLSICRRQQIELSEALAQLADDIFAGRKRHRTYRQLKMYNDPNLNPYLYNTEPTGSKSV